MNMGIVFEPFFWEPLLGIQSALVDQHEALHLEDQSGHNPNTQPLLT
jgi:hypothetical protein